MYVEKKKNKKFGLDNYSAEVNSKKMQNPNSNPNPQTTHPSPLPIIQQPINQQFQTQIPVFYFF